MAPLFPCSPDLFWFLTLTLAGISYVIGQSWGVGVVTTERQKCAANFSRFGKRGLQMKNACDTCCMRHPSYFCCCSCSWNKNSEWIETRKSCSFISSFKNIGNKANELQDNYNNLHTLIKNCGGGIFQNSK